MQGHLVHVPEVYISPPARAEQAEGREFHIVPARDEPGEAGRERTGGPSLAAAPAAKRHSGDLAEAINAIVLGWMTYRGRFYRTEMIPLLKRINTYLMRWARKKYKRLRGFKRLKAWWIRVTQRDPVPTRLDGKTGVTGDCHAPFCGGPGARFPRATRHCKDGKRRRADCAETSFTFLGYTFRARNAPTWDGTGMFTGFLPAVSKDALKRTTRKSAPGASTCAPPWNCKTSPTGSTPSSAGG